VHHLDVDHWLHAEAPDEVAARIHARRRVGIEVCPQVVALCRCSQGWPVANLKEMLEA
jgi:hypothetical protein